MSPTAKKYLLNGLLFVAVVGGWAWYDLSTRQAKPELVEGVKKLLAKDPSLQPLYDEAMKDGVLTTFEAGRIVKQFDPAKR
jgi:hypothetical protein